MGGISIPGAVSTAGAETQELNRPILVVWIENRKEACRMNNCQLAMMMLLRENLRSNEGLRLGAWVTKGAKY
jgi:hypothetical protein